VGILDAVLLFQMSSPPALFAIGCGALFVIIFLSEGWYRWVGILLIFCIVAIVYMTDYPVATTLEGVITLKDLFRKLSTEERIQFWADAWRMLKDNHLAAWIVGNGIGSFQFSFPKYLNPLYDANANIHPHNYFLEVLHENGIIGFVLIFGGLSYLIFLIAKKAKRTKSNRYGIFLKCIIAAFIIWFILCGLNFPVYTTFTTYPLGFILGTMLVIVERIPPDEILQQDSQG
jgi:O-antigen ligase